jgi:hypothetical protein
MFPPITNGKEKQRHTKGKVVKSHQEQIVINEGENDQTNSLSAMFNRVQKIKYCYWKENNVGTEKNLFRYYRRKDNHQNGKGKMGQPIGEEMPINIVKSLEPIFWIPVFS